jgi:D-3-phosphoglycerate dehydrogenase
MLNRSRDDYAYNIIDIDSTIDEDVIAKLRAVEGVVMVRVL